MNKERPFYNKSWFGWLLILCALLCPPTFMYIHHHTLEAWGSMYGFGMGFTCLGTMVVLVVLAVNIIENDY